MNEVYIVAAVRTPIGSFGGSLAAVSATQLGAAAIKGALLQANLNPNEVQDVLMGNVVSAGLGQAPARQAAIFAGLPSSVQCTTINKVCASGTKAIMYAAQSIALGDADVVVAGGMESMSNIPYYMPKARYGYGYGHGTLQDGLVLDGLTDVYSQAAMGTCADATAEKYEITREEQDEFAINSYKKAAAATENGSFKNEITAVSVPQRKGDDLLITQDEEYKKVSFEKIPALKPVFTKTGTVTAANASTINDGAAALILVSGKKMQELGLKPIAKIIAFADAEQDPQWFTTAPTLAAPKAAAKAGISLQDIDFFEVNEAFAAVTLGFIKILGIDAQKVNVNGGAVALGHPLGASGARIVVTLAHILQQKGGKYGMAAICNGGGGASAIIIERV